MKRCGLMQTATRKQLDTWGLSTSQMSYAAIVTLSLLLFNGVILLLILIPGCCFAELAHGCYKRKNKRVEGCFKFSVQISLLELVYNTERLCHYWLFAEFFNISWLLFLCSDLEETYSACIIAGGIYSKQCKQVINVKCENHFAINGNICLLFKLFYHHCVQSVLVDPPPVGFLSK